MTRITLTDYWMGRDKKYPPTEEQIENAHETVAKVNAVLEEAEADGVDLSRKDQITGTLVSSGYRPPAVNERTANAAKKSKHLTCQGCDIQDSVDRQLASWCKKNPAILARIGLWVEDPRWTFSTNNDHWVHFQTEPPGSGSRFFAPSSAPPKGPHPP